MRVGRECIHWSISAGKAKTGLRSPGRGRRTVSPAQRSQRCAVRTPRFKYAAISFQDCSASLRSSVLPFPLPFPLPLPSADFIESICISNTPRLFVLLKGYLHCKDQVCSLNDTKLTFFDACQNQQLRLKSNNFPALGNPNIATAEAIKIFGKRPGSDRLCRCSHPAETADYIA